MKKIFHLNDSVHFILSEAKLIRLSDGQVFKLRSPAAFCLALLLENQESMVSHRDLMYFGWERFGIKTSLSVLHNTIFYLRRTMSELDFEADIIETVPRRGFVFSRKVNVSIHQQESDNIEFSSSGSTDIINNNDECFIKNESNSDVGDLYSDIDIATNDKLKIIKKTFNEIESDELNIIEKKTDHNKIDLITYFGSNVRRYKFVCYAFFIAIFFILMSFFLYLMFYYDRSFPGTYKYLTKFENCHIYQSNSFQEKNNKRILQKVASNCKRDLYIYATSYLYSNDFSIIYCKNKLSLFSDDECYSALYIQNNHEGD